MNNPEYVNKLKAAREKYTEFFEDLKDNPKFHTDSFNRAAAENPTMIKAVLADLHQAITRVVPEYYSTEPVEKEFLSYLFEPAEAIPTSQTLLAKLKEYQQLLNQNLTPDEVQEYESKVVTLLGFVTDLVSQGHGDIVKWFLKRDKEGEVINRGDLVTSGILVPFVTQIQMALMRFKKELSGNR
jgi:hypothetical protein